MESIVRSDLRFPQQLSEVRPVVKKLFYLGDWDEKLFDNSVAIVGSRRMTSYGERMIERIVPELVEAGVTIVSGFMYGVDQKAHQVCVECGGKTVAVVGWGIDYLYDKYLKSGPQNGVGYQKIVESGGLIVSEWSNEVPLQWMFPYRNRIVAGLVKAVLIVEAAERSGSLNTAKWAVGLNRKLLALPGPATSSVTEGTNGLIKSGAAQMVTTGAEILSALGTPSALHASPPKLGGEKEGVLKLLEGEPLTVDEIAKKLKRRVEDVIAELGILELKGSISSRNDKYYVG